MKPNKKLIEKTYFNNRKHKKKQNNLLLLYIHI